MTNNKLTDERIASLIYGSDGWGNFANCDYADIACALTELQERRRAEGTDYISRMRAELHQLTDRAEKLHAFSESPGFANLSGESKSLMREQYDFMCRYADVLFKRIRIAESEVGKA